MYRAGYIKIAAAIAEGEMTHHLEGWMYCVTRSAPTTHGLTGKDLSKPAALMILIRQKHTDTTLRLTLWPVTLINTLIDSVLNNQETTA